MSNENKITVLQVLTDSLVKALENTNNKKMKQKILLELYRTTMLRKYNLTHLTKIDFMLLANQIKIAISMDNFLCYKSYSYSQAFSHFHLAHEWGINSINNTKKIPTTNSHKKELNEIIDSLYHLIKFQQKALTKDSQKHRSLSSLLLDITNLQINCNINRINVRTEELRAVIHKTRTILGKHTRLFFTNIGITNGLKICEPELKRLEYKTEGLNRLYAGTMY